MFPELKAQRGVAINTDWDEDTVAEMEDEVRENRLRNLEGHPDNEDPKRLPRARNMTKADEKNEREIAGAVLRKANDPMTQSEWSLLETKFNRVIGKKLPENLSRWDVVLIGGSMTQFGGLPSTICYLECKQMLKKTLKRVQQDGYVFVSSAKWKAGREYIVHHAKPAFIVWRTADGAYIRVNMERLPDAEVWFERRDRGQQNQGDAEPMSCWLLDATTPTNNVYPVEIWHDEKNNSFQKRVGGTSQPSEQAETGVQAQA